VKAKPKTIRTADVNASTVLPQQCCWKYKLSVLFKPHPVRQNCSHFHYIISNTAKFSSLQIVSKCCSYLPMVTIRLSLTETLMQNPLTTRAELGLRTYGSWARCGSFEDHIWLAWVAISRLLQMKLFL